MSALRNPDLSHNSLKGDIHYEWNSLVNLHSLKLSFNKFSGPIPIDLFLSLRALQIMKIDHNCFSRSLDYCSNWGELNVFDISFNDFYGDISVKIMLMPEL